LGSDHPSLVLDKSVDGNDFHKSGKSGFIDLTAIKISGAPMKANSKSDFCLLSIYTPFCLEFENLGRGLL